MARADTAQVRALATRYVSADSAGRALALRADPEWSGPDVLEVRGRRVRVAPCPSPLAVRAALIDHHDPSELLVVLTPFSDEELGPDVQARLHGRGVQPLDPFSSVLAVFGATVLDPLLVRERPLIEDLVTLAPTGGWPRPALGNVLDAGTAWRVWHEARLAIPGPPTDLADLVAIGRRPEVVSAIAELPSDRREMLKARWAEALGPLARLLIDLFAHPSRPDPSAYGLVAEVLWSNPESSDLAATQTVARARLEHVLGRDLLNATTAAAWGEAARSALGADPPAEVLDTADQVLLDAGAGALAILSDDLPRGFDERLRALGAALADGDVEAAVARLAGVRRHRRAKRGKHRVAAAAAAVRLLRHRQSPARPVPTTFPEAAATYAADGAFVDRAVRLLDEGDTVPELAAAYATLATAAAAARTHEVESFAALLGEWSKAEPVDDPRIIPLEHLLDRVLAVVARVAPVLLVVCDGMSLPVAHDLLDDLGSEGWAAVAPAGSRWPTGIALLPTVTETSRASLLTGTRTIGGQDVEQAGFAEHPALRAASRAGRPPVLLHKAALVGPMGVALPEDVRRLVADPDQRIVGVVVNAVDDHLARGDQVRVGWDLNAFRPLGWLLDAAQDARRVVVVTADHGHVLHRPDAVVRQLPGGGERWRTPPPAAGEGEIELAGPRVLLGGGRVVVPVDARLRYSGYKHGYHGGATPEEVLVPVALLARTLPEGWQHYQRPTPNWWAEDVAAPPAPTPVPTRAAPQAQPTLFEPTASARASWVDALLTSPLFVAHRERVRLPRPLPDERLRRYLTAIDENGSAIPLEALAARVGEPPDVVRMVLSLVQRLANLDGAPVLQVRGGTVEINRELANLQFGIAPP